jgi:putative ABC transport system permease protein
MVKGTLLKNLTREILSFKAQVFSIALVIGIGVAVYFGFSTTYDSLLVSRDHFYQEAHFPDLFSRLIKAPRYLLSQISTIEGVEKIEARIEKDALISLPKMQQPGVGHFITIPDQGQPELSQLFMVQGRLPNIDEVVVSESFFKANKLQLGHKLFATIDGKRKEFKISGIAVSPEHIIAIQQGAQMPDDKHFALVWINQSVLESALDMRGSFNTLVTKLKKNAIAMDVKNKIDDIIDRYGGTNTYDRSKQPSAVYVREELKQLNVQASTIPIFFFLVAAFILNIVISRLTRTQRSQIATLKALGYSNLSISQYYLILASLIVLLGTLIGILLGIWIGVSMVDLYGLFYHFPLLVYKMSYQKLMIAIIASLLTAFLGTFSSLKKVFKLQPADAMKPPSPTNYANNWLEATLLFQSLRPKSRMIIRGLITTPIRSLMMGLGVSFSVVLLILGLFWSDSLEVLIQGQYNFRQKESARIQLTHEMGSNIVYQIERLTGVLKAEGYRVVPVEVNYNQYTETTSIKGYPENYELAEIIDENFQKIELPKRGFHISQSLANKLSLKKGDQIELKILSGKKPIIKVKVSQIIPSFFENQILTTRKELARLMQTDDLVNTVVFRSLANSSRLYTELKKIPTVLSITFKESAMKMFTETSAKFLLVFALIFSLFAGAIAFGISYNNLRVTLSERDWEISTLMILGFKNIEVFKIITSEVLTLVLGFIPLGWFMGYYNARWLLLKLSMEEFPIPLHVSDFTYGLSASIVVLATAISFILIFWRLKKLDLVATLKSRT